ncbi:MAG TPA: glycosyltransferase family 8 protein [Candidatus Acidoferrum sp.]|nr:glycosyltransferase family 8 protein [Candidatus Acidoferrum sp.]
MDSRINIVCAADAGFTAHLATMLLSLVSNNRDWRFRVFVLHDGPLPGKQRLAEFLRSALVEILFICVEDGALNGVALTLPNVTRVTYARLLVDRLLPPDIDRVLYLDCDLVVCGEIGDLWKTDLHDKIVGAVTRATYPGPTDWPNSSEAFGGKLKLPPNAGYFNAGVLLINLRKWREKGVGARALAFVHDHPDRITSADQCAINFAVHGDWLPLDPIWNHQQHGHYVFYCDLMCFKRMTRAERAAIRIVHFTGPLKPWHYLSYHPLKAEYLEYRNQTPWPLESYEDRSPHNIVRRFLHRYLPLLLPVYLGARKMI